MDKDGFSSSGVWKFCLYISPDNVVLSVYYWYYLQVGLCYEAYSLFSGVGWSLDQI